MVFLEFHSIPYCRRRCRSFSTHKAEIIETETHYQPAEGSYGCSIQILREVSKREITREEAKTLIEKREIGPFGDFRSKKTEREFSSKLHLKKNESIGYKFAKL